MPTNFLINDSSPINPGYLPYAEVGTLLARFYNPVQILNQRAMATLTPFPSSSEGDSFLDEDLTSSISGRGSGIEDAANSKRRAALDSSQDDDDPQPSRKKCQLTTPLSIQTPNSSTHDISNVPHHIANLHTLAERMQAATQEAWSRRFEPYNAVHVLLLYWEDDDLGVVDEVKGLESTFRDVYNYNTEIWRIGDTKPDRSLKIKLGKFCEDYDNQGNLLILYYAGHARANDAPGQPPYWVS